MGARGWADARLFPRRGFRRPPLLALPRRPLRPRSRPAAMVHAWVVRVRPRLPLIRRFAPPSPAGGRRGVSRAYPGEGADDGLGAPPLPLAGEGWGEGKPRTLTQHSYVRTIDAR